MTRFTSARLRLTFWYIALVAIVAGSFSLIIYQGVSGEIQKSFSMAETRLRTQNDTLLPKGLALKLLNRDLDRAKNYVVMRLIVINGIIIAASGVAAWILAGKTLSPIEASLEEQKRFTADASHELKTPLTSLRTELEVALRDKKLNLAAAKKLLKSNLEDVVSLTTLSENLMKLNRYSQNLDVAHTKTDFNDTLGEAIKKMSFLARKKDIKISDKTGNIKLSGDRQSLTELFTILLDNAIKYSPEKSVVKITSSRSRHKVTVEIADQGIGIAKADIPHLFDRFYRADTSRSKNTSEGFGLGLAIAREIVEGHHGEIQVKSKIGIGTTFSITLPA